MSSVIASDAMHSSLNSNVLWKITNNKMKLFENFIWTWNLRLFTQRKMKFLVLIIQDFTTTK